MTSFARGLSEAQWTGLRALRAMPSGSWWDDLLSLWVPSGHPSGDDGLRLTIRNGYLNFYRRGQSVARVCFGPPRGGMAVPRMEIHARYVEGPSARATYLRFGADGRDPPDRFTLRAWIANTARWHGAEKWGVDEVVGRNPGVIDLEMGIPGSALRVDIVALEGGPTGPRLTLWEAKPLDAGALRARVMAPNIVEQMKGYREFCERAAGVLESAYRAHCAALIEFANWAGKADQISPLVAEARTRLSLNPEVGLVVFRGVRCDAYGRRELVPYAANWSTHRARLAGVTLREAEDPADLELSPA